MFTGIVQDLGSIKLIESGLYQVNTNLDLSECKEGSSISCNGVCLTAKNIKKNQNQISTFEVNIGEETLMRTNLGKNILANKVINIEKSLKIGDEIGGHFVYGHVDTTAVIRSIEKVNGSYKIIFKINKAFLKYFASKGSVSVDGVSLTVNDVDKDSFTVNIVPYTWLHTSFKNYKTGSIVNIEIDILVRYLESLNTN